MIFLEDIHFADDCKHYYEELDDKEGISASYNISGTAYYGMGKYDDAVTSFTHSLEIAQNIDDKNSIARTLTNMGECARSQQEYKQAQKLYFESLSIEKELGFEPGDPITLNNLGFTSIGLKHYAEAREYFILSIKVSRINKMFPIILESLLGLAVLCIHSGSFKRASEYISMVTSHSACDSEVLKEAERLLPWLKGSMSKKNYEDSAEQGKKMDLDSVLV